MDIITYFEISIVITNIFLDDISIVRYWNVDIDGWYFFKSQRSPKLKQPFYNCLNKSPLHDRVKYFWICLFEYVLGIEIYYSKNVYYYYTITFQGHTEEYVTDCFENILSEFSIDNS